MLSKAMGWDQLKDDSIMMKGQGDTLMAQMRDMYGMGKGLLSGTGQFYDSAMKSFTRDTTDAMAQNARNITRNFAAKGAGGGFADMINANQTSSGRLGEARQGFFSNLYSKGAQIGAGVMQGSQGFSGQAGQAYNRSTQLNEKRSDIATGFLNQAIGLAGGFGMQNLVGKQTEGLIGQIMGTGTAAKASATSQISQGLKNPFGGGQVFNSPFASAMMGMQNTGSMLGPGNQSFSPASIVQHMLQKRNQPLYTSRPIQVTNLQGDVTGHGYNN